MSEVDDVLFWNRKLIDLIKQNTINNNPISLNQAVNSIKNKIPPYLIKRLRWINWTRNLVVHRGIDVPLDYAEQCEDVYNSLKSFFSNGRETKKTKDLKSEKIIKKKSFNLLKLKRYSLLFVISVVLILISILFLVPVKSSNSKVLAWNPQIDFLRDDDILSNDDYYLKLSIYNGSRPYNGKIYISIVTKGVPSEKSSNVKLIEGEKFSFELPIDYSLINRENADKNYISKCLEGSQIRIKTGYVGEKVNTYTIRNGKLL